MHWRAIVLSCHQAAPGTLRLTWTRRNMMGEVRYSHCYHGSDVQYSTRCLAIHVAPRPLPLPALAPPPLLRHLEKLAPGDWRLTVPMVCSNRGGCSVDVQTFWSYKARAHTHTPSRLASPGGRQSLFPRIGSTASTYGMTGFAPSLTALVLQ